jgi:aspartyl-tRNA(Asn)/glutamyl-tRNA(Gln) amidotransferase subunit A
VRHAVEAAIISCRNLGCEVVPVSLPHTEYAIPTYYLWRPPKPRRTWPASTACATALGPGVRVTLSEMYRRSRDQGFGAEVKRRIMLGTYALSAGYYDAYYLKAQKVRTLLVRDFEEAFKKVDAIVTPTSPTRRFKLGEKSNDPWPCIWPTFTPSPRIWQAFPGFQFRAARPKKICRSDCRFSGKHFDEATILRVAHAYEQVGIGLIRADCLRLRS